MAAYQELIKNFEKIRAYMRDFYVYGFKSRSEYDQKSARTYDDGRRRLESWLGDHMNFVRTAEGKNVFLSIDSRSTCHNPLYKAWKAKSFTDGDVTLHFILFDLLHSPEVSLSLAEILERIDGEYLQHFSEPMLFDESTVRKKLKEYCTEGLLLTEKRGRTPFYHRAPSPALPPDPDLLHFFSEVAPCGVIGSFLLDKFPSHADRLTFKHHYITQAMDSDVLALLFDAMREKRAVTVKNHARSATEAVEITLVPLRVFISVQSGRQHLLAHLPRENKIRSYRIDYLSDVVAGDPVPEFDALRAQLSAIQPGIWGVNTRSGDSPLQRISFTVHIAPDEGFILRRLEREKRCGFVEAVDESHYRFTAEVFDAGELLPWVRTFFCRITEFSCSNALLEARFFADLREMYRMYGIEPDETTPEGGESA